MGRRVDGYDPKAILEETAEGAEKASETLEKQGYYIKIFDAYRPQRAVDDFVRWAKDVNDTKMKQQYYPHVDKANLFELGYIAERSGHTKEA